MNLLWFRRLLSVKLLSRRKFASRLNTSVDYLEIWLFWNVSLSLTSAAGGVLMKSMSVDKPSSMYVMEFVSVSFGSLLSSTSHPWLFSTSRETTRNSSFSLLSIWSLKYAIKSISWNRNLKFIQKFKLKNLVYLKIRNHSK